MNKLGKLGKWRENRKWREKKMTRMETETVAHGNPTKFSLIAVLPGVDRMSQPELDPRGEEDVEGPVVLEGVCGQQLIVGGTAGDRLPVVVRGWDIPSI